ncbi:putative capsid protein, partial [Golovinomyces cichoracearum]
VVNYAGKNKDRTDSHANSKSSTNYHKPLNCIFHRQKISHIQNDCPDYLKIEPGKKWLRSNAGIAWAKGASKRKNKGHNIRFRGSKGCTTNNDESSDDDNAVLNMVSSLNTGEVYETDNSVYSYFPRKTAFAVPEVTRHHDWSLDTCASRHITPNCDFFIPGSLKSHKNSIKYADNSLISSRGI